jgi:hypothetical protein
MNVEPCHRPGEGTPTVGHVRQPVLTVGNPAREHLVGEDALLAVHAAELNQLVGEQAAATPASGLETPTPVTCVNSLQGCSPTPMS